MDVIRFGLGLRALRHRRRLTQAQLAMMARVSPSVVGRIERGGADRVTVRSLERVAAVIGARVEVRLLWQGEGLDRLLDARHASLVERIVSLLKSSGWEVLTEVSFNIRSERGSIDVLAYHSPTSTVLVVEVKSVAPDLQGMLFALDRKARLAPIIAADRGWTVDSVGRLLVFPEDRTVRRRIDVHRATFDAALPARNVEARRWLRTPSGGMAGVLFLTNGRQATPRHRVRGPRVPRGTLPSSVSAGKG